MYKVVTKLVLEKTKSFLGTIFKTYSFKVENPDFDQTSFIDALLKLGFKDGDIFELRYIGKEK